MEIVPLVQLSLGIFVGLLVLALLISYISFRIKKNHSNNQVNTAEKQNTEIAGSVSAEPQKQNNYSTLSPQYYSSKEYVTKSQPGPIYKSGLDKLVNENKENRKFTVLNEMSVSNPGFVPETTASFSHKFASSKSKDAFAMFR